MLHQFEINQFNDEGFLIAEGCFTTAEVELLKMETLRLMNLEYPGKVLEDDRSTVRSINGPHLISSIMNKVSKTPRLLNSAQRLLGDESIYIHQYKINIKHAFVGDIWEWHTDYWFWHKEDGMPKSNALSAVIFLDEINEYNGPMILVPKSHKIEWNDNDHTLPYGCLTGGENWQLTTSSKLKYQFSKEQLKSVIAQNGLQSAKGRAGSVLFFHSNLLHSSGLNLSPWDRKAIFISYNLVSNALHPIESPRPSFLASRDFAPIEANGERDFLENL
ncbi:phytanoyl-CoA dioxygenase [Legionella sp. km535]|uniref:phytanoyl-CoA dioxygenase family protein n=1 Tax=Legionella sp. km535 TaxID=2498107 RepID=UPI000F8F6564|nr:phytanoyl-CoA dioxygenase family protein [Legionella sp. km535]RUR15308.1 phytanoyl-CoA dioxygenase [Legionella sp. km535]